MGAQLIGCFLMHADFFGSKLFFFLGRVFGVKLGNK